MGQAFLYFNYLFIPPMEEKMKIRSAVLTLLMGAVLGFSGCAKQEKASTPAKAGSATPSAATSSKKVAKPAASTSSSPSQPVGGISVIEAISCRSVENRAPVGEAASFTTDVGRVYLYTKVGMEDGAEGSIKHVWHYDGKEVATVTLPVKGPQWRTYSSKQVDNSSKGEWRVDITSANNELIKSVTFKVE
jgi:hypothetical protein